MNLLLTGAFDFTKQEIQAIKLIGYNVEFVQEERATLNIDVSEFDVVVCNSLFLYNEIQQFIKLRYIQTTSVGIDRLPIDYIRQNEIAIYNAGDVYSVPMAEWTICKILEMMKQSHFFYANQLNRSWVKNDEIEELYGKVVTIMGYGNVGREIAKRLRVFGVRIIAVDVALPINGEYDEYVDVSGFKFALMDSDIIILTLPLTPDTKYIFDRNVFSLLKRNCILVNVSRGEIIKQDDLVGCLRSGQIRAASLDVFEGEPIPADSDLWDCPNLYISPHISYFSKMTRSRLLSLIIKNLEAIMKNSRI